MDEQIKSNLALNVAQLSLDKATLQAQVEQLQAENKQLKQLQEVVNGDPALLELVTEAMNGGHS